MEASGSACPTCGGSDTPSVEVVWDSRHDGAAMADLAPKVTPPTPRAAATNAGWFYLFGCLGLIAWIVAMVYVSSLVAARAASVFFVSGVAAAGVVMLMFRIFTGSPKPTTDQIAALEEWKVAHATWRQQRICLHCKETFTPPPAPPGSSVGP